MGAALIMAVSVPTAFGDGGMWFAVGYIVVRSTGVWLQLTETTDADTLAGVRFFAAVSWIGPLVLLFGALVDAPARSWIWLAAVLLEVGSAALAGGSEWRIRAGHFAERHGLIYIIALGEGIVAVGIVAAGGSLDGVVAFTMLLAIAGAAVLWCSYFDRFGGTVEQALRGAGESQGAIARDAYSLGHYPMIAGVVLFAAAAEEIVHHPGDALSGFTRLLVALAFGLAMLTQFAIIKRVGRPALTERMWAAAIVGLLMVPSLEVRANVMLLVVVLVVAAALGIEHRRGTIPVAED